MADQYVITGQQEVVDFDTPQPTPSYRVTFETLPHHIVSTVTIPKVGYGPGPVHDAVTKAAAVLEAVADL